MCWSEIDLDRGVWTLPASRSKNGRAHTLPLLPMMLDIIKTVPRMVGRDQLFGVRGVGFTGWSRGKEALDARSRVKDWTTHDLRRTVATKLADIGVHAAHHRAGFESSERPQGWSCGHLQSLKLRTRSQSRVGDVARSPSHADHRWRAQGYLLAATRRLDAARGRVLAVRYLHPRTGNGRSMHAA